MDRQKKLRLFGAAGVSAILVATHDMPLGTLLGTRNTR